VNRQIKNRYTNEIIVKSKKYSSTKIAVEKNKQNLEGADLNRANLKETNLSKAYLMWADLSEVNLRGAYLSEANLMWADLSEVNLRGAYLSEANLRRANLSEANLREANLSEANLIWANLSEANLSEANLREAYLRGANLRRANLNGADLWKTNLNEVDLREANYSISIMNQIDWDELSDELTLELMRHDAEICGSKAMTNWVKGGKCPFSTGNIQRLFYFNEKKELWKPGKPRLHNMELWKALCKEKGIKI